MHTHIHTRAAPDDAAGFTVTTVSVYNRKKKNYLAMDVRREGDDDEGRCRGMEYRGIIWKAEANQQQVTRLP